MWEYFMLSPHCLLHSAWLLIFCPACASLSGTFFHIPFWQNNKTNPGLSGVVVSSSYNSFELSRDVDMSLPIYLLLKLSFFIQKCALEHTDQKQNVQRLGNFCFQMKQLILNNFGENYVSFTKRMDNRMCDYELGVLILVFFCHQMTGCVTEQVIWLFWTWVKSFLSKECYLVMEMLAMQAYHKSW
jgi:hypothetical protein